MTGALNVSKSTHASSSFIASKKTAATLANPNEILKSRADDPMTEDDENTQNKQPD